MENKSRFLNLNDEYLDTAMKNIRDMKSLGVKIPKEEELFTSEIKDIYEKIKKIETYIPSKLDVDKIEICNNEKRNLETFYLIKKYFGKSIENTGKIYEKYTVNENSKVEKTQSEIAYQKYKEDILPTNITISSTENSIQSVILASTLLESIKNKNMNEFKEICQDGKTIPIFLNLLFSQDMSKKENNSDLNYAINIFQLWLIQTNIEYYEELIKRRDNDINRYLGKVAMSLSVYPYLTGYVDALKLEYLYRKNPKFILKQIKYVIQNMETTKNMLNFLKIDNISTNEIIDNKIKELKLS